MAVLETLPQALAAKPARSSLESAIAEWQTVLPAGCILNRQDALQKYGPNTAGISRAIPLALIPQCADDVAALVRIAGKHRIALYPISTGKNWGYGCANPVTDDCVIVDLSQLNRIVSFDAELGLVTLEPGVTQRMLAEYLDERGLRFMVPVTGAGPDASLLGNAMERGYGLTPYSDHFAAVMRLEAVLPNGQMYRSALTAAGGLDVDNAFKWGAGPYLDGLFAQGNYGIVTQVTIALAPISERIEAFFFSIADDALLEETVHAVREVLTRTGAVTGALNLMNTRRMLSMIEPYPSEVPPGTIMPRAVFNKLAARHALGAWTGAGALYGPTGVVRAAKSELKRILRPVASGLTFLTEEKIAFAQRWTQRLPFLKNSGLAQRLKRAEAFMQNVSGRPSEIALPLAYWKSGRRPSEGPMNPSHDGCGLLWYAPLVPMKPACVRAYVAMVERICEAHGIEPLITLTSFSNRCFDSTVPILFDRSRMEEVERAHTCYHALFEAGRSMGMLPYRLGVHSMQEMVDPDAAFWKLGAAIKNAIDPHNLIAPGRYASIRNPQR